MGGLAGEPFPARGTGGLEDRAAPRGRLDSIDLVRGLVMVIMALDHVRDYFSRDLFIDLTNLGQTSTALFLTRWVTHFCAPTFVFLAGTGAFLAGSRGKTTGGLAWFLLTRGLWLVLLEVTWVHFAWNFHLNYGYILAPGVLWAIGWSMVCLSGLVFLPTSAVAVVGVGIIAFHNLLDNMGPAEVGLPQWLWTILHQPGQLEPFWGICFATGYSFLPWLGVMAAGYGFGAIFLLERGPRRKQLFGLGLALTAVFIALRFTNLYGDPSPPSGNPPPSPAFAASVIGLGASPLGTGPVSASAALSTSSAKPPDLRGKIPGPWSPQDNPVFTVLSFVNCQKYPPSLLFLLMTLGPAITALALFDRTPGPLGRFFVTFGRVPLFFYLLHIPLIHGLVVGLDYIQYGWSPYLSDAPWTLRPETVPKGYGYSLGVVYLVWVGVVLALYPVCHWFAGVKQRRREGWLSYL
jgi:uncharacterized membrane protein